MGVVNVYVSSRPCTLLKQIKTRYECNNVMREKSVAKAKGRAVTPANRHATKAYVIPACYQIAFSKFTISVMLIFMKG